MNWIRKRLYWIAGILVGGMVLWLITSAVTLQSIQGETAGTLFGRPVPAADYLKSLQAVTHQQILAHGDRFRKEVSLDELEGQAWERLIFLQEAKRKGIRAADREVVREIRELPLFRDGDGRFDERGYHVVMQYTLGTTPRVFEEEMRENLLIQKMIRQVVGAPTATEEEIKARFEEKKKEKPEEWKDFGAVRPNLEKEVIAQKRLRNYLRWHEELLKRAKPRKSASHLTDERPRP